MSERNVKEELERLRRQGNFGKRAGVTPVGKFFLIGGIVATIATASYFVHGPVVARMRE